MILSMLTALAAASVQPGQSLCYAAALPDDGARQVLAVRVQAVQPTVTGVPGAWVQVTGGRLDGIAWHVPLSELRECSAAERPAAKG